MLLKRRVPRFLGFKLFPLHPTPYTLHPPHEEFDYKSGMVPIDARAYLKLKGLNQGASYIWMLDFFLGRGVGCRV